MANIRDKAISVFVALALAFCFVPMPVSSQAHAEESTSDQAEQLDFQNALPSDLIVTYKNEAKHLNEPIAIEQSASSTRPVEKTTLEEMGVENQTKLFGNATYDDGGACSLLTFEEGTDLQEKAEELLSSPDVESVQPNYKYDAFAVGSTTYRDNPSNRPTNDPYSYVNPYYKDNQYYLYTTKVADAWVSGAKSNKRVTVAVMDTAVSIGHEDLNTNIDYDNARDFTNNSQPYGVRYGWWTGGEAHGTHVAGILGAVANNAKGIAGTSYNANVLPLRVLTSSGGSTSTLLRAYSYLTMLIETRQLTSLKVINLSLGGKERDELLQKAIAEMTEKHGVLTVAASGNDGDTVHQYPADFPQVLSVMSTTRNLTRASFSTYGSEDVSAPGVEINSIMTSSKYTCHIYEDDPKKQQYNGTSYSCPIVSGIAALCYSVKPNALAQEVKMAIKMGAESVAHIDANCAPFVNALNAVNNIRSGAALAAISLSSATSAPIGSYVYTGSAITPKPTINLGGRTLEPNVDYTVEYSSNVNVGVASVTIKGINDYLGSTTVDFEIIPKKGPTPKLASKKKALKISWSKAESGYADGYKIRYSTKSSMKNAKTVTVKKLGSVTKTIKKLKAKKRYYVQICVYKKASGKTYYGAWSAKKSKVTKK